MAQSIRLGAINRITERYESIYIACKNNSYKCPDCNKDVILRQGLINRHHFAHKKDSNCSYYEHPNESQIHKDAKMNMKRLIENKKIIIKK